MALSFERVLAELGETFAQPPFEPAAGTDSGVANAYVYTHSGPLVAGLNNGTLIRFTPLHANTGPSTINVNATGVVNIVGAAGAALSGGELTALGPVLLQYNGTAWQIAATTGATPTTGLAAAGTDSGAVNAYVYTHNAFSLAATLTAGTLIRFIPLNTNTSSATLNADGTGAVAIIRANGSALTGGEFSSLGPVVLQSTGTQWQIVSTAGAQPGFERTAAETAAAVVPVNYTFVPGDARRWGKLDGVTDDTTQLQNWVKVLGTHTWPTIATAIISGTLTPVANSFFQGAGFGSQITQNATNTDIFAVTSVNNVVIQDMGFFGTASSGGNPFQAAIHCVESNDVSISRCRFQNFSFICVAVQGTTTANNQRIKVRDCRFDNWNATQMGDSCGVGFLDFSLNCEMSGCTVIGNDVAPSHGCLIQNTNGGVGDYSRGHKISKNSISHTLTYGIICYRVALTGFVDQHVLEGNVIDTVSGAALGGASGAGIYIQGGGPLTITGNDIRNTNVNTTVGTLAPAAIGINSITGDVSVTGNTINNPNWYGVYTVGTSTATECAISAITQAANAVVTLSLVSSTNPFIVGAPVYFTGVGGMTQINGLYSTVTAIGGSSGAWTITVPINSSAFTAYTSGGLAVLSYKLAVANNTINNGQKTGIYINDQGNVSLTGNQVTVNATAVGARGILCTPVATNLLGRLLITGNKLEAPASLPLEVDYYNDITVCDNDIVSNVGTGALQGMQISNCNRGTVSGNNVNMGLSTSNLLVITSSTNIQVTGNTFTGAAGNQVLLTSGTCTGCFIDKSNKWSTTQFQNAGAGCHLEYMNSSGNPNLGTSTSQTGDVAWNALGTQPLAYTAAAGGTPGTWSPEFFSAITVVPYSASMTFNASVGSEFDITATNNTAFTINAPNNPVTSQRITIKIRNTSGGALGAITFNAVFKLAAFTAPATANSRSVDFAYDGTNWVQIGQTGVDIPN